MHFDFGTRVDSEMGAFSHDGATFAYAADESVETGMRQVQFEVK